MKVLKPTLVDYITSKFIMEIACGDYHSVVLVEPHFVFVSGLNKFG